MILTLKPCNRLNILSGLRLTVDRLNIDISNTQSGTNLITLGHTELSVYDNVALFYTVKEYIKKTKDSRKANSQCIFTLKLHVICKFISTQHKLYNYKFYTCIYITCILCKWKHVNYVVQSPQCYGVGECTKKI